MISKRETPFTFGFVNGEQGLRLELTNTSESALRSVDILTVFLKDEETPGGGPSQAHIRFDSIERILPHEKSLLSHRTWINGKPARPDFTLHEFWKTMLHLRARPSATTRGVPPVREISSTPRLISFGKVPPD